MIIIIERFIYIDGEVYYNGPDHKDGNVACWFVRTLDKLDLYD